MRKSRWKVLFPFQIFLLFYSFLEKTCSTPWPALCVDRYITGQSMCRAYRLWDYLPKVAVERTQSAEFKSETGATLLRTFGHVSPPPLIQRFPKIHLQIVGDWRKHTGRIMRWQEMFRSWIFCSGLADSIRGEQDPNKSWQAHLKDVLGRGCAFDGYF